MTYVLCHVSCVMCFIRCPVTVLHGSCFIGDFLSCDNGFHVGFQVGCHVGYQVGCHFRCHVYAHHTCTFIALTYGHVPPPPPHLN